MNTSRPLVSIIVPIYGTQDYIAQCARSLMAQTWPHIQYIFVDDGSPDRAVEVLEGVLADYPERNVLIHRQSNVGLPKARAAGLALAEGEYIMHLDSDDWIEPDAVEKLVNKALETGADLVYHDFWKEYSYRSKLDVEREYSARTRLTYMRRLYRDKAYGYLWNKFARRRLYEDMFIPSYNMHEDVVMATQMLYKAGSLVHLNVPLVHYRRNNPSASTLVAKKKRRGQMARNYLDFYEFYRDRLPGSPVEPVLSDLILRAAWVAYTLDRDLFRERPYLLEMARHLPFIPFHRIPLVSQCVLKVATNVFLR